LRATFGDFLSKQQIAGESLYLPGGDERTFLGKAFEQESKIVAVDGSLAVAPRDHFTCTVRSGEATGMVAVALWCQSYFQFPFLRL